MSCCVVYQSGIAKVFWVLMSIVVIRLCDDMMVCSFRAFSCQLRIVVAVSSAKVRMVAGGMLCASIRVRLSDAIANASGESGHPCRMPRVAVKP